MNNIFTHKIRKKYLGKRVDETVADLFGITKSQAQKTIKANLVRINGEPTTSKKILKQNDSLEISSRQKRQDIDIPILYQDKDLIVVNKPSGITVHPAKGEYDSTITELMGQKEAVYSVHRLDKGTSGILLIAKNTDIQNLLQEQFRKRIVEKKYLVLIEGRIKPRSGLIDIPVGRDQTIRHKISPKKGGREALTEYNVIDYYNNFSYIEASPKTGRTHQIRVHFSAIGFPVVGDERYGSASDISNRLFLHAASLSFTHPSTKKRMSFRVSLPDELNQILKKLK